MAGFNLLLLLNQDGVRNHKLPQPPLCLVQGLYRLKTRKSWNFISFFPTLESHEIGLWVMESFLKIKRQKTDKLEN